MSIYFCKKSKEQRTMEKLSNEDGSVSLIFCNEIEYRQFMFYYSIGKDIAKLEGVDTNVLP